jgi:hypothetical protein
MIHSTWKVCGCCLRIGIGVLPWGMSGLPPKLAVVEFGVEALSGQQFLVDALLDDAALFAHEHPVGVAYGAQAVCVNEYGNRKPGFWVGFAP